MLNRAYSIVTIKTLDEDQRIIGGVATSAALDRVGDSISMDGVKVAPDIPLFLYHDSRQTVGRAKLGKATAAGIPFEAHLPKIAEPGPLRDLVETAWQLVKYKLVTGVSIGFRVLDDKVERLKDGGLRYLAIEVLELSLVPVPANAEATITSVKDLARGGGNATPASASPLEAFKAATEAGDLEEMIRLRCSEEMDKAIFKIASANASEVVNSVWREKIDAAKGDRQEVRYTQDTHDTLFLLLKSAIAQIARLEAMVFQRATIDAVRRKRNDLRYVGVFKAGETYRPGNLATYGGSLWHCNSKTSDAPPGDAWTLAVRRGKDGRDFEERAHE